MEPIQYYVFENSANMSNFWCAIIKSAQILKYRVDPKLCNCKAGIILGVLYCSANSNY
jgi:hypothetical protein